MKKFVPYPHISQFRNIISGIKKKAMFKGLDDAGEPVYNGNAELPTITFKGSTKLHGTNSSVCRSKDELWTQSRNNIITIDKDNAGFASFVLSNEISFNKLLDKLHKDNEDEITDNDTLAVFGEWAGRGIQKGISISALDKMFVIFGARVADVSSDNDEDHTFKWLDHSGLRDTENGIYNIEDFETWYLPVDFNRPDIAQVEMIKLVEYVEKECPVGKALGVPSSECTIGEGIVWKAFYKDEQLIFKTKGTKHSTSRVKTVAPVDVEKMNSIHSFVDYAVTENRLNQAIEQAFTLTGLTPSIKEMGSFIRWIVTDITREEADVIKENNLTPKEINKHISYKSRKWFSKFLDIQAGL